MEFEGRRLDIVFASEKLAKTMNSDSKLTQSYGADRGKAIRKRLDDLDAADVLEVMRSLPGRCEELTGHRSGELSVRLTGNWRLIFRPNHDPKPIKEDGGLDWTKVTAVEITEVVDYH